MQNGYDLYKRIGEKDTYAHRWNRLPDDQRKSMTFEDFKLQEAHKEAMEGIQAFNKAMKGFVNTANKRKFM